jgi:hypothetical protein
MISQRHSISLQLKTTANKIQQQQEKQALKQTLCATRTYHLKKVMCKFTNDRLM